jgi:hypothetical protein
MYAFLLFPIHNTCFVTHASWFLNVEISDERAEATNFESDHYTFFSSVLNISAIYLCSESELLHYVLKVTTDVVSRP